VDIPACEANGQWLAAQTHVMFQLGLRRGESACSNPICTQNTVEGDDRYTHRPHDRGGTSSGFAALSTAVGGEVTVVCAARGQAPTSSTNIAITLNPGMQTLSGQAAVRNTCAPVRASATTGDIGRMKRQQAFMAALAKKILGPRGTLTNRSPL